MQIVVEHTDAARIEMIRACRNAWPCARNDLCASNYFLGLVVSLAVTAQRGRLGAGVKLRQTGRDLGVFLLEQAVAGEVAFDEERSELLNVEHPHRLRQPQFLEPVHARDPLDAAPEQRAR